MREADAREDGTVTVDALAEEVEAALPLAHCVWGLWALCALPEAIAQAKKERELRKAKQAASALKADSMLIDPQAAELGAGGGLKSKVLSEDEVELRWDTTDEAGNAGFIVQRRRGN